MKKARHDAVTAAAVPNENSARAKDTGKFGDHTTVIGWIGKEAERREEIQHSVEAFRPPARQSAHVAAVVSEIRPSSPRPRPREELAREVEPIDTETRLGEKMRMASLTAGNVQNPRGGWQPEEIDDASHLATVALQVEERLVFAQIIGVEIASPPVVGATSAPRTDSFTRTVPVLPLAQKKTGSR